MAGNFHLQAIQEHLQFRRPMLHFSLDMETQKLEKDPATREEDRWEYLSSRQSYWLCGKYAGIMQTVIRQGCNLS